ncbi:MAG: pilus assembly protein PilM [Planctomycetota bacterium]
MAAGCTGANAMKGLLNSLRQAAKPAAGRVGIDLGSNELRLVQLEPGPTHPTVAALATQDVADDCCDDFAAFCAKLPDALRRLKTAAGTKATAADIVFPSRRQHWLTLRLPKLDAMDLGEAVRFEVAGKLPFDPAEAMLRHEVAGEVHTKDGPRLEVLVSAARKRDVSALVAGVEKAGLEPRSFRPAPAALRDALSTFYTRTDDPNHVWLALDLGRRDARAYVIGPTGLRFARNIDFDFEAARAAMPSAEKPEPEPKPPEEESFALLGAAMRRSTDQPQQQPSHPLSGHAGQLAAEIVRCRRYHDTTFASSPIDRLIFMGGGSKAEAFCRDIAKQVGVLAQVADFSVRLELPELQSGPQLNLALGAAAAMLPGREIRQAA